MASGGANRARVAFYQAGPRIGNPYLEDPSLQRFLRLFLSGCDAGERGEIEADLERFGDKCAGPYLEMAQNAERFKPELEQFDQWGRRVDRLHLAEGWKYFKAESAIEGIVAIPHERKSPFARVHQAVKLALFTPSSGMYGCPLAMTSGSAYAIENLLNAQRAGSLSLQPKTVAELEEAYANLTTRDPAKFWTSGQWFTEKKGGSDLSRATETVAVGKESAAGTHELFGYKWFTSAVDADMTLLLASISESADAPMHGDRRPLSLFFMRLRRHPALAAADEDEDDLEIENPLNGVQVVRLKDKMATRSLPTAELVLEHSNAHLVSPAGSGVKTVMPMLVITRFYNSITAVANQMRMRNLAIDFAHKRNAFGDAIANKPLHLQNLFEYDMDTRGNLLMVLEMARLLGRADCGQATEEEEALLRIYTTLSKLFTAREVVRLMSDGVELFGAVGVMENHMSTIMRDSAVLPIWEGTTNTLALDLLRAVSREPESFAALHKSMSGMAEGNATLIRNIETVFGYVQSSASKLDHFEWNARRLAMNLSRLLVACLSARTMKATDHPEDHLLLEHWLGRVEREFEKMSDPSLFKAYRDSLPSAIDGRKRDERGKPRSYL